MQKRDAKISAERMVFHIQLGGSFLALIARPFPFEFGGSHASSLWRNFFPARHGRKLSKEMLPGKNP
jgi:hypothetical protein